MDRPAPVARAEQDAALGLFDWERLSGALVATHRAGFGPQARVLDPARGDVPGQIRRAGFSPPPDPRRGGAEHGVDPRHRARPAARVGDIFAGAGAKVVHLLGRGAAATPWTPPTSVEHAVSDGEGLGTALPGA
jgi:hypothetical protein